MDTVDATTTSASRWALAQFCTSINEFLVGGLVLGALTSVVSVAIPALAARPTIADRALQGLIGFVVAVVLTFGLGFLWFLLRAPYQERNKLRDLVEAQSNDLEGVRADLERRFATIRYSFAFDTLCVINRGTPRSVHVGIAFANLGPEALAYDVVSMAVSVAGVTIANPTFSTTGAVLAPQQKYFQWFPWLRDVQISAGAKGEVSYEAHYGHPTGPMRYRVTHRQEFECLKGFDGAITAHVRDLDPPIVTDLTTPPPVGPPKAIS